MSAEMKNFQNLDELTQCMKVGPVPSLFFRPIPPVYTCPIPSLDTCPIPSLFTCPIPSPICLCLARLIHGCPIPLLCPFMRPMALLSPFATATCHLIPHLTFHRHPCCCRGSREKWCGSKAARRREKTSKRCAWARLDVRLCFGPPRCTPGFGPPGCTPGSAPSPYIQTHNPHPGNVPPPRPTPPSSVRTLSHLTSVRPLPHLSDPSLVCPTPADVVAGMDESQRVSHGTSSEPYSRPPY